MTFILTLAIMAIAVTLMSIALILTGRNRVHSSCSATHALDPEGSHSCDFCPEKEDEDQVTTLAKAGYPGRSGIISPEAYENKPRIPFAEKLKYRTGRDS